MCLHRTKADQVAKVAQEILSLRCTPESFLGNARRLAPRIATLGLKWRAGNLVEAAKFVKNRLGGTYRIIGNNLRQSQVSGITLHLPFYASLMVVLLS